MAKKKAEPVTEEPKYTVQAKQYIEVRFTTWGYGAAYHLSADEAYDLGWKLRTAAQELS